MAAREQQAQAPAGELLQQLQAAVSLHQAGRLAEAEAVYRQILRGQPNQPDALHLLGLIASARGRPELGTELIERAVAVRAHFPHAYYNLGRIYQGLNKLHEAETNYRRALAQKPNYAEAHDNLGGTLHALGRLEEAMACYDAALTIRPDYAEAWSNRGAALQDLGRPHEAVASYRRALALRPNYTEALHNLGEAFRDLRQMPEAIACYEAALALRPDYAEAHCGLSFALLSSGQWERGWAEYEWRWKHPEYASELRNLRGRPWQGENPEGKTILLYAEQGFGDTLQFVRYAPLAANRGATVIVECQPALARLLRMLSGVSQVVERGAVLPHFDLHASLVSLPFLFGTRVDSVPAAVPYLRPPAEALDKWRGLLEDRPGLKVGLVWASNPANERRRSPRSVPLAMLEPLARVTHATFYSLQKGPAAQQLVTPWGGGQLIDLGPRLDDFAETAAAILQLDLVISVDTAVAHLAGALAREVWTLLPYAAEWRWLLHGTGTPWYPSMRLFRQPRPGDWQTVVSEVVSQLALRGQGSDPPVALGD